MPTRTIDAEQARQLAADLLTQHGRTPDMQTDPELALWADALTGASHLQWHRYKSHHRVRQPSKQHGWLPKVAELQQWLENDAAANPHSEQWQRKVISPTDPAHPDQRDNEHARPTSGGDGQQIARHYIGRLRDQLAGTRGGHE